MATPEVAGSWKFNGLHRQESLYFVIMYKIICSFSLGHFFANVIYWNFCKGKIHLTTPHLFFMLCCIEGLYTLPLVCPLQLSLKSRLSAGCIPLSFYCSLPHYFRSARLPLSFGCPRERSDTVMLSDILSTCSIEMKRLCDYNLNYWPFCEWYLYFQHSIYNYYC